MNYKNILEDLGFQCFYNAEPFCDEILEFQKEDDKIIVSGELDLENGIIEILLVLDKDKHQTIFNLSQEMYKIGMELKTVDELIKIEEKFNFSWFLNFIKEKEI